MVMIMTNDYVAESIEVTDNQEQPARHDTTTCEDTSPTPEYINLDVTSGNIVAVLSYLFI